MAGSAPATARNTTPPAASARDRRRPISTCLPMPSSPIPRSGSADAASFERHHERTQQNLVYPTPLAACAAARRRQCLRAAALRVQEFRGAMAGGAAAVSRLQLHFRGLLSDATQP